MNNLYFLLSFILFGTLFVVAGILTAFLCSYRSENIDKSTYECGLKPFGSASLRYDIRFINYAIMFLIFDSSLIFLFPFAVIVSECSLDVLISILLFLSVLLFILIFAIIKRILRWQ